MPTLVWSDALKLDNPRMDATHVEFVDLLTRLEVAPDDELLPRYRKLVAHTEEHFAQEDRWMLATGFAPENCHTRQHATVLAVMREVVRLARDEARWEPLGVLVNELALWFPQHAQMMDAGLAQHMADVGYDPATGVATGVLPAQAITRCGSQGCG